MGGLHCFDTLETCPGRLGRAHAPEPTHTHAHTRTGRKVETKRKRVLCFPLLIRSHAVPSFPYISSFFFFFLSLPLSRSIADRHIYLSPGINLEQPFLRMMIVNDNGNFLTVNLQLMSSKFAVFFFFFFAFNAALHGGHISSTSVTFTGCNDTRRRHLDLSHPHAALPKHPSGNSPASF